MFDEQGELIGRAYSEFEQHFPRPRWVEHDPRQIWEVTHAVAGQAMADAGIEPGDLEAVGITNQRETVCVWDPSTGEPLHNAIVWQDRRTADRFSGYATGWGSSPRPPTARRWRAHWRATTASTSSPRLMQFQADVLGVPVVVPEIAETTALGAAYLAGVGIGLWTVEEVRSGWRERFRYEPQMSDDQRATLLDGWRRALERARAR